MGRRTPGRGTLRENIPIFKYFFRKNFMFGLQTTFFDSFNVLVSFLAENDAERSRNYFNKSTLNPKHTKFDQNPGDVRAVGGIMGYSGSVNLKHLLRYMVTQFYFLHVCCSITESLLGV